MTRKDSQLGRGALGLLGPRYVVRPHFSLTKVGNQISGCYYLTLRSNGAYKDLIGRGISAILNCSAE